MKRASLRSHAGVHTRSKKPASSASSNLEIARQLPHDEPELLAEPQYSGREKIGQSSLYGFQPLHVRDELASF